MYWSKYNRIYRVDNERFAIYNYAWNKCVFIVNYLMDILQEHINAVDNLSNVHSSFYDSLVANKMIVTDSSEEIQSVKQHILSITIGIRLK